jgi:hypothetical protein
MHNWASWLEPHEQGDRIGRIFAQWVIVYFGQFSENNRSRPHFWGYFYPRYAIALMKNVYIGLHFRPNFFRLIWSHTCPTIFVNYTSLS